MIDTVLDVILCIFLGASLANTISLTHRIRAAKEQARSGGKDDEPRMSPKEAWRQSLFVTSFLGFLIVYTCYKTLAGTWPWPLGTIAILVTVWLIRKPLAGFRQNRPVAVRFSTDLSLAFPSAESVAPGYIASLLASDSVLKAINADLVRTDRIGHKEPWSLCLITSGQDRFDPRVFGLGRRDTLKRMLADRSFRSNIMGRVPVRRSATLHSSTWFKYRFNNVLITTGHSMRSHGLSTRTNAGEFTRIRDLQVHPASARGKSTDLPQFLRESGFPLRHAYSDGDPLTTERGGTIVSDEGQVIVIYPEYFVQRRVIDDDGQLVYLGLSEDSEYAPTHGVEMRPSTSALLFKCVSYHGYVPILRYRSFPYASDLMLPLLDTPMSASGWADLFIDTRGRAKLFVAKERTLAEWREMLDELKQLLYSELARKDYHLLSLTRDPTHLNDYLVKKQAILAKHYYIDDFVLWGHTVGGVASPRQGVVAALGLGQSRADAAQTRQRRRLGFIQDEPEPMRTTQRRGLGFVRDEPEPKRPRMKTYQNAQFGFEIDLPEQWPHPVTVGFDTLAFDCGLGATFNIVRGFLIPERLLDDAQFEFTQYAHAHAYTDVEFGRISAGANDHLWARYTMPDGTQAKKYMVVFAQLEFAITATSRDPLGFPEKEKTWDAIVGSFRPHDWLSKAMVELKAERGKGAGGLYGTAYKAAADGRYSEACALLEQCLRDDPDHILAHKKLAFVLKNMGDVGGALRHRQEVKRLDPSDTVNRFNLAGIYALLGAPGDALREADELLAMEPDNPMFLELRRAVARAPVAYPQHYEEESREHSGKARNLRLLDSIVPELPYLTHLLLQYHWEEHLPDEEARNLALRAIALVCCAIYDAALSAGLRCDPSPIPNGRRPAWLLEGEKSPVSLILSDIDFAERTCQMTIGPMMTQAGAPPGDRARWERLRAAFMKRFSELSV